MWIMTPFGILMPSDRTAYTPEGDERTLQVRTRRARDLDILRALYLPELGETIHTPTFDYNYRAYCTREQFAAAMAKMVMDIDYEKFKPTTDRFDDNELHGVYNSIWGSVTRLGEPWEAFHGRQPGVWGSYLNDEPSTGKRAKRGRRGRRSRQSETVANDGYAAMTLDMDAADDEATESYFAMHNAERAQRRGSLIFGRDLTDVTDVMAVHSTD